MSKRYWLQLLLMGSLFWPAAAQAAPGPSAAPEARPPATLPSASRPATRPTRVASAATTRSTTRALAARVAPPIGAPMALPPALLKPLPDSVEDLRALQAQLRQVVARVAPAVVGLRVGGGQGSGVIVSEDGLVLTAAHVSGAAERRVTVLLQDGRQVSGTTLGANQDMDAGMIRIDDPGPLPGGKWPVAAVGTSSGLKVGQWCIALGHPGGYRKGRSAPLRLGRVLELRSSAVRTDCTLVGGDSGGPLFDLHGRVIGIHSRIGGTLAENLHVPVDAFRNGWGRLASAEVWGEAFWLRRNGRPPFPRPQSAYLGIHTDSNVGSCRVERVDDDTPAQRAGMRAGDIVRKFDDIPIRTPGNLQAMLALRPAGKTIEIVVERDGKPVTLKVTLGKRPDE